MSNYNDAEERGVAAVPMLTQGTIFDKYRIIRLIGQGGMSEVYLAEHILLKTSCALKVMKKFGDGGKNYRKRFLREAGCFLKLGHPNIVRMYEVGCDQATADLFIAMEYLPCGSLAMQSCRRFSEDDLLDIAEDIAGALCELSKYHIVHRDIKPANIMYDGQGHYKLMDLGIAKVDNLLGSDYTLTVDQLVFGTPAYASPEQCRSPHETDCRSDIYSLGATLYFLACGQLPFNGKTPVEMIFQVMKSTPPPLRKMRPDLSSGLIGLINMMMERSADQRPANAEVLLAMIRAVRNDGFRQCRPKDTLWPSIAMTAAVFAVTAMVLFVTNKPIQKNGVCFNVCKTVVMPPPSVKVKEKLITPRELGIAVGKKAVLAEKCVPIKKASSGCAFRPVEHKKIKSMLNHMVKYHGNINDWKKAPEPQWFNHIGYAAQKAEKENKMLLIFVSRSLVFPEFLSENTEYKKWLTDHFVLMFCDCDYLEMPKLQRQQLDTVFRLLRINIAPSTVILSPDGRHLSSIPGAANHRAAVYRTILSEIVKGRQVHFDSKNNYFKSTPR